MWQKIKDQLPTVILTVIIVVASAFWIHQQTVAQMAAKQQAELAPLREQNDALKAASEDNRRQIEALDKLLKDAISKRAADVFMTDEEVATYRNELEDIKVKGNNCPRPIKTWAQCGLNEKMYVNSLFFFCLFACL